MKGTWHHPDDLHCGAGAATAQMRRRRSIKRLHGSFSVAARYLALYLTVLGTGGLKSSVSGFGSDQFDETDWKEKHQMMKFFNWFFFFISLGSLLVVTVRAGVHSGQPRPTVGVRAVRGVHWGGAGGVSLRDKAVSVQEAAGQESPDADCGVGGGGVEEEGAIMNNGQQSRCSFLVSIRNNGRQVGTYLHLFVDLIFVRKYSCGPTYVNVYI